MRTVTRALLCGLFASTLGFAACGGDDDNTPTDTKADSTADVADSTATDSVATDSATATDSAPADSSPDTTVPEDTAAADSAADTTAPGDTVAPAGSCNNSADLAIIQANDPAGKAGYCGGSSCITTLISGTIDQFKACVQTCMLNAELKDYEFAVSADCTTCYTDSVGCTAEHCGLNDPNKSCVPTSFGGKGTDSADCTQCRSDNGCDSSFVTCSGLTPTP